MHQNFNYRLELKTTPLLHTSFYTTRVVILCKKFEKEVGQRRGHSGDYFAPLWTHPWADLATITLVGDHEYFIIPTRFPQNPSSSSGEEIENDLA